MSFKKTFTYPNYTVDIFVTENQVINPENDWIDAEITLKTGEHYCPSFFTIKKIQEIMISDKRGGEFLNGSYFWAADQIIVDHLSETTILKTIKYLYSKNLLAFMFCNTQMLNEDN